MNPANINDPTAVKALLDQLKASQVWQDTLSSSSHTHRERNPEAREPPTSALEYDADVQAKSTAQSSDTTPSASVASLLSQLRASEWPAVAAKVPPPPSTRTAHQPSTGIPRPSQDTRSELQTPRPVVAASSTHAQDIRSMTFQQALPHLTRLSSDPEFLAAVSRLRQEQDELEKQLWEERQAIHRKHEEKVKVARTKATLVGAGLSKHEADMMNDAYRRDLQRFDKERVLLAWAALVQKQQSTLETLGVPTMFPTNSRADLEKQRRVVQVLEGL